MRGIYAITNILTGTVYYGQSKNIKKRWYHHLSDLSLGKHDNDYLQRSWNKYGKEAFVFAPVEVIENIEVDLTPIEKKYFDSTDNKYNLSDPKDPTAWTLESRAKQSSIHKGKKHRLGYKEPEETKEKLRAARRGRKPNLGKHPSLEARQKMSLAKKGKTFSEEHKKKLSESHRARIAAKVLS